MSLLPQQKKSAEEIAKLRESLGIVAPPTAVEETAAEIPVAASEEEHAAQVPEILETPGTAKVADVPTANHLPHHPAAEVHLVNEGHVFQRAAQVPVLAVEESGPPPHTVHPPESTAVPAPAPVAAPHAPKIVRSLRKSEQVPLAPVQPPAADSRLPILRHSDQELNEIRRREALAKQAPWVHPQTLTAHLALVVPGYLFAIAGAVYCYFYDIERQEMRITAGCAAIALLFAAFIFFKKPHSRHHAAFIAVAALFVIIFGALYYFPQLRHGT